MKDCRKQLVKALITAINSVSDGVKVYTKVPKGDAGNQVVFPYIYITEITDTEDGPKNKFHYSYSVSIEIVYAALFDKVAIWEMANKIKGLFNICKPFEMEDSFEIMQAAIEGSNEREDLMGSTDVDVLTVRILFLIEEPN